MAATLWLGAVGDSFGGLAQDKGGDVEAGLSEAYLIVQAA